MFQRCGGGGGSAFILFVFAISLFEWTPSVALDLSDEVSYFCMKVFTPPLRYYKNSSDPDCHNYIECTSVFDADGQTEIVGKRRRCDYGFFWEPLNQRCIEEGPGPSSLCRSPNISLSNFCKDNWNSSMEKNTFPHPYDCHLFIVCFSNGTNIIGTIQSCGQQGFLTGLYIGNPRIYFYDDVQARCIAEDSVIRCKSPLTFEVNEWCKLHAQGISGYYTHPYDCHAYIQCLVVDELVAKMIGEVIPCGKGEFWDTDQMICAVEGQIPCKTPSLDLTEYCGGVYNGVKEYYVHPYDCTVRIKCTIVPNSAVPTVMGKIIPCEKNYFWDGLQEKCVPQGKKTCTPQDFDPTMHCKKQWVWQQKFLFEQPYNCSQYVECMTVLSDDAQTSFIVGQIRSCNVGTFWSNFTMTCIDVDPLRPCHAPAVDAAAFCRQHYVGSDQFADFEEVFEYFAHPYDCHYRIGCVRQHLGAEVATVGYIDPAPKPGYYWDDVEKRWLLEDFVSLCKPMNLNPTYLCRASWKHQNHSFYASPVDCHSYIECVSNKSFGVYETFGITYHCDPGYFWDKYQVRCVPAGTQSPCSASEEVDIFSADDFCAVNWDGSRANNITYPYDCHYYVECAKVQDDFKNWKVYGYRRRCEDGSFWNSTKCIQEGSIPCKANFSDATAVCYERNWLHDMSNNLLAYNCSVYVRCVTNFVDSSRNNVSRLGFFENITNLTTTWGRTQCNCLIEDSPSSCDSEANIIQFCKANVKNTLSTTFPNLYDCHSYIECDSNTKVACPNGAFFGYYNNGWSCIQAGTPPCAPFNATELCRQQWDGQTDLTFLASSSDCHGYIKCERLYDDATGVIIVGNIYFCGDGLVWSQEQMRCVEEDVTACTVLSLDVDLFCQDNWNNNSVISLFGHPFDCHSYILCTASSQALIACDSGTFWDDSQMRCIKEGPVACQTPKLNATDLCWTWFIQTNGTIPYVAHPYDCHSSFLCIPFTESFFFTVLAYEQPCDVGYFWDEVQFKCVLEGPIACQYPVVDANALCNVNDSVTVFAHNYNCTLYINCTHYPTLVPPVANGSVVFCEAGFYWNDVQKRCITKSQYGCVAPNLDIQSVCANWTWTNNTQQPHPYDCHQYIQCIDPVNEFGVYYTEAILHSCDSGTFFDPSQYRCVTEGPRPCALPSLNVSDFCGTRRMHRNWTYAHPYDCHLYVECINTTAFANGYKNDSIFLCPNITEHTLLGDITRSTFWDQNQMRCVVEGSAACNPPKMNATTFCIQQFWEISDQMYSNPFDCHQYIECHLEGQVPALTSSGYVRVCDEGTYWDDLQDRCVMEGEIKCEPPLFNATVFCNNTWQGNGTPSFYTHPYDCHAYITCSQDDNGTITGSVYYCGKVGFPNRSFNTFWDSENLVCAVETDTVACQRLSLFYPNFISGSVLCNISIAATKDVTQYYVQYPGSCHVIVKCYDYSTEEVIRLSEPEWFYCIEGYFFDPYIGGCVTESNAVLCKPPLESDPFAICQAKYRPGSDRQFFADTTTTSDCSDIIQCSQLGNRVVYESWYCLDSIWNDTQYNCVVEDPNNPCNPPPVTQQIIVAECASAGAGVIWVANPFDCHSFIACDNSSVVTCRSGTFFSELAGRCLPESAELPCQFYIDDPVVYCNDNYPAGVYVNASIPDDCHLYIQCPAVDGALSIKKCGDGLFFFDSGDGHTNCVEEDPKHSCHRPNNTASSTNSTSRFRRGLPADRWVEFCNENRPRRQDKSRSKFPSRIAESSESYITEESIVHIDEHYYPHPSGNCHQYIECLHDSLLVIANERQCGFGMFWSSMKLACVREDDEVQCRAHPCSDSSVAAIGKYRVAGMPCNSYYICNSSVLQGSCDQLHRFNPTTGDCDYDATCRDSSSVVYDDVSSKAACQDLLGNVLVANDGDISFTLEDTTGYCAEGSVFSVRLCRCYDVVEEGRSASLLWLPFDNDFADYSSEKLKASMLGSASYDPTSASSGRGGSLRNHGNGLTSHLHVSGLGPRRNKDLTEVSWCLKFRCEFEQDSFSCSRRAGILSTLGATLPSNGFTFAIEGNNAVTAALVTAHGKCSSSFVIPKPLASGWHHVCVTFASGVLRTYHNMKLVSISRLSRTDSHHVDMKEFMIGSNSLYGAFAGHIDDVLVCERELSRLEMEAHFKDDRAQLNSFGLIPL